MLADEPEKGVEVEVSIVADTGLDEQALAMQKQLDTRRESRATPDHDTTVPVVFGAGVAVVLFGLGAGLAARKLRKPKPEPELERPEPEEKPQPNLDTQSTVAPSELASLASVPSRPCDDIPELEQVATCDDVADEQAAIDV